MSAPPGQHRPVPSKFKVLKFLGKGSYGSVFQVQRLSDNQTYALKEMDVRSMSQVEKEDAVNEIRLLASVQHPNVIGYHEAFLDGNRICIIMEYAPDGDLAKVIKKAQLMKTPLPEDQIWRYFIQIAQGLQALHQMKILHRDIKPGNIMVTTNDVVKIGDLGIAKLLKSTMAKTQIGTPHYMPPEIWRNRPYAFSSDTWSLGCMLFEMAMLKVPFEAHSMADLRYRVLKGSYPPVTGPYSAELVKMVAMCLEPNNEKRPTINQILATATVASRLHLLPSELAHRPPSTAGSSLLDTIKVPKNLQLLKDKLPPALYPTDVVGPMGTIDEDTPPEMPNHNKPGVRLGVAMAVKPHMQTPAVVPALNKQSDIVPPKGPGGYVPPPGVRVSYQGPGRAELPQIHPAKRISEPAQVPKHLTPYNKGLEAHGAPPWGQAGPRQPQPQPRVSESRANYGAFYQAPAPQPRASNYGQGPSILAQAGVSPAVKYLGHQDPKGPTPRAGAPAGRGSSWYPVTPVSRTPQGAQLPTPSGPYKHGFLPAIGGGGYGAGLVQQPLAAGHKAVPPPWNYGRAKVWR